MLKVYKVSRGKIPVVENAKLKPYKFGMTLEHDFYISGNNEKAYHGRFTHDQNINNISYFIDNLNKLLRSEGFVVAEAQHEFVREYMK